MILIAAIVFWSMLAIVAYAYCVFPVLLAAIARIKAKKAGSPAVPEHDKETPASLPRVTMVVAAFNEAAVLSAKLANTHAIDYPADRFELLIGSDGSEDATAEILGPYANGTGEQDGPRIRCRLFTQRRGKISVLNDLMNDVDSEIVVMSDANTMFAPDAIMQLVRHFLDERVGCVSGQLSLDQDGGVSGEGLYWAYEGWIKRNESRLGFLIGCNGGIFALRRELYEPLPPTTIVEDFVLTLRVLEGGHQVLLEREARATEPACVSSRAEMVRKIRIGAGGWQALGLNRSLLHPRFGLRAFAFWGHKVLRWLAPCFLIIALIANIALVTVPFYAVLLGLQVLGLILAALAYLAGDKRPLPKWTRPASYFYLMNYALFCGLLRFIFKKQRVTWDRAPAAPLRTHSTVVRETAPVSDLSLANENAESAA